jgi:hypothetical protein
MRLPTPSMLRRTTLRVGLQNRKPRYEILGLIRGPLVGHAALGTEGSGSQRRRDLAIKT